MAPNVATYGALAPVEVGAKARPEVSLRLTVAVAVCSVMLFFAGRAPPSEFSHAEVLDLAAFCDQGKFIGGCNKCKECSKYEFANGGCSYFKNTFCTFCQPIKDCPRELITCDGVHNSQCDKCNCDDPITAWTDKEVRKYTARHKVASHQVGDKTFGCYISDVLDPDGAGTCKPCTVCPVGKWQRAPCDQDTNHDTVCVSCTECQEHEFTARTCTYTSDTECRTCNYCGDDEGKTIGTYTFTPCVLGNPLKSGQDAVCKQCSTCDDGTYVNKFCEAGVPINGDAGLGADTECHKCSACQGSADETQDWTKWSEHIAGQKGTCKKGERFPGDGCMSKSKEGGFCVNHDTVCQDCLTPMDDGGCDKDGFGCDFFFSTPCDSDSINAPVLKACKSCGGATFEIRSCSAFEGAVCKPCAENMAKDPSSGKMTSGLIEHCNFEDHRCAGDGSWTDSVFGIHHSLADKANNFLGGVANIKDFEFEDEISFDHVVLSWCARADETGACNGKTNLWWSEKHDDVKADGKRDGRVGKRGSLDPDQDISEECNYDACNEGFFGTQCQYAKVYSGCVGESFMERTAKKGRYWYNDKSPNFNPTPSLHYADSEEKSENQFLAWCYQLCEEHPFCHAFEIEDGGDSASKSGPWELAADTVCKFYEKPQFCDEDTAPDYGKDCFVNVDRYPEGISKNKACPGAAPTPGAALYPGSFEPIDDHGCDSYEGESWCEELDKCVNRAHTPCADKKKLRDQCKDGKVYCYCTGRCMALDGGLQRLTCEDHQFDDMPADAMLTLGGLIPESCWAVNNNVEAVAIVEDVEE